MENEQPEMAHRDLAKPKLILLDVYETLLDMADVERRVNKLLDNKRGYTIWFELFMQYCFVDSCMVQFHPFASIARATLQMAAKTLGEKLDEEATGGLLELLKHLPAKDGVQEGLSLLHDNGYRIAALTNSPQQIVMDRMERTGLVSYFEEVLSAEHVKKYKPCIEVYDWAAGKLGVGLHEILLVSAHSWDIAGAANAGMQTAYVLQPAQMLYPLAPLPDYTCKNLADLAGQLSLKKTID